MSRAYDRDRDGAPDVVLLSAFNATDPCQSEQEEGLVHGLLFPFTSP